MNSLTQIRKKINLAIKNGGFEDTFLHFIFMQIRIVLEEKKQKKHYPYLTMVCNWYMHPEIDLSKEGYSIIQKIGELLILDLANNKNDVQRTDDLIRKISTLIGMGRLRDELNSFFIAHEINPIMTQRYNWDRIVINIAYDLQERPIKLPVGKEYFKNMYECLRKKAQELQVQNWEYIVPVEFSIFLKNEGFYWNIEMQSGINLQGPLLKSSV